MKVKTHLTKDDVIQSIEKFLSHRGDECHWEEFTCVPLDDPKLDAIRLRCLNLREEWPPQDKEQQYCSDEGLNVLRRILSELRQGEPAESNRRSEIAATTAALTPQAVEDFLNELTIRNPSLTFKREDQSWGVIWRFPQTGSSDYSFHASFEQGNLSVSADLRNSRQDEWFWYSQVEDIPSVPAYVRFAEFKRTLMKVLFNPTRITQMRGWLFWKFQLEALIEGVWKGVAWYACLRWKFKVPNADSAKTVYRAEALGADRSSRKA